MKLKRLAAWIIAAVMTASSVTVNVFADSSSEEVAVYTENDTNLDDDEDIDIPIPPDDEDTDEPEEPNEPPEPPVDPDEPEDPDIPVEPFSYSVLDDGTVQITAYNGSAEKVDIPEKIDGKSVTSIGESAFSDCTNLTSITIPDSVTSIGDWAFSGCTSLISITIPDSVTSIGDWAFIVCTSLISITIPNSVTSIGDYAFCGCTSLIAIDIAADNEYYTSVNGVLFNKGKTELICYPAGKTDKSYNIPNSVTSIVDRAFSGCTSLASITIPDSVTEIGYSAFSGCTSLTSIMIPDSVKSIGNGVFEDCTSLTNITIPDSVTSIGDWAFESCTSLTAIDVEVGNNNYTSVDGVLFNKDKTELICYPAGKTDKSYNIPDSVTSIGNRAFDGCTSLTSITIPSSVTEIGGSAFSGCTSLMSITILGSVTEIGSEAFSGCTSLTNITIPDSVTSIGDWAFCNCSMLMNVEIPVSVEEIGDRAFGYLNDESTNWETIANDLFAIYCEDNSAAARYAEENDIPHKVSCVGPHTYSNEWTVDKEATVDNFGVKSHHCTKCGFATDVTMIPQKYELIYETDEEGNLYVSDYRGKPVDVVIPAEVDGKSVTGIGKHAFNCCKSLTSITIPDSVTSIGDYAFSGCTSLTAIDVEIGNSNYTSVNGVLFNKDKTELICYPAGKTDKSYNIPNSVTRIDNGAFSGCASLASVTIPDSVTSIGDRAFYWCTSLTSITIPNGVTSIGESAFDGCASLASVTIPDSVTSIGESAFEDCSSLTSITIPNGVTSIGESAFDGCTNLTSITIPNSVTSIGESAFEDCSSLTAVDVATDNEYYTSVNGVLFNKDKTELICYPIGKSDKSYTIPNSATSISTGAFRGCTSLASIMIPDSVTEIGSDAFNGCTSLTSITIPDSVTSIGDWAFNGTALLDKQTAPVKYADSWVVDCDSDVKTVMIKNGTKGIANRAFSYCDSLTSITIPDSVTSIGEGAFSYCDSLTSITIPDSVTSIGEGAFNGCTSLTSITIPNGVTSIGGWAFSGCTSLTSITIPNGVTSIGDWAFSGCISLTSITIPDSVTSIGDWAFSGCTSLTNITIPDSVTEIGSGAFSGCTSLTNITIPDSVTEIGWYAFSGCTSLTSITIPDSVTSIGRYAFGYYYDNGYKKIDNFKINCYTGTTGEKYAKENGFEYELLDHIQHTFGEWKTAKAATCTAEGTQTRTCSVCDKVETQTINALGHEYSTVWTTDKAATCGAAGSKSHHCTRCGAKKDVTAIPATGKHDFNNWKTTKAATYTATGTKTRTCKVCKKTETATIAKLTLAKIGGFKVKAKDNASVTLQWNKNANASGYIIEAYNGKTWSQVTKIAKNSTLTYKVTKLSASKTYQYRIKAYKTEGKATQYSAYTATLSVNTNPSNMSGFKAKAKSYNSITLQWNKNASATGYELQKWDGKKWVTLTKINKNSTTTYTVKSLKASTTYKYRIRAYKTIGKATQYSAYSATLSVNTNPSNMSGFKAKSKSYNSITLQWNKNASATGYELQKWDGKKWVTLTKINKNSTTTYTVKGLKASTTYKYRIRAYKTIGKATQYSAYTATLSVNTNPYNMSGFKAKSKSYNSITLQWNKNTSATGYELQKWDGKKWVSAAKVTKNSTVTSTVKNLKKNTSYKFRIRAYKTIGKATQYSSWSGTLTVKTKK